MQSGPEHVVSDMTRALSNTLLQRALEFHWTVASVP
jgi:hypothetical protein